MNWNAWSENLICKILKMMTLHNVPHTETRHQTFAFWTRPKILHSLPISCILTELNKRCVSNRTTQSKFGFYNSISVGFLLPKLCGRFFFLFFFSFIIKRNNHNFHMKCFWQISFANVCNHNFHFDFMPCIGILFVTCTPRRIVDEASY